MDLGAECVGQKMGVWVVGGVVVAAAVVEGDRTSTKAQSLPSGC